MGNIYVLQCVRSHFRNVLRFNYFVHSRRRFSEYKLNWQYAYLYHTYHSCIELNPYFKIII
jgi:hypothetical protein